MDCQLYAVNRTFGLASSQAFNWAIATYLKLIEIYRSAGNSLVANRVAHHLRKRLLVVGEIIELITRAGVSPCPDWPGHNEHSVEVVSIRLPGFSHG
jgi:hypothetical protein